MGLHTSDGLTVRVGDLPPETIEEDVARFFNGRVGPSGVVIAKNGIGNLVPEVNRRTKLTTVTFVKQEFKVKALKECHGIGFSAQRGDGTSIVSVEDEFMGLTTLHCTEGANVDIVALHGVSGHAWDSFASSHSSREGIKETCWLRDELPRFFQGQSGKALRPRVMSYGYHANIWVKSTIDGLDAPVLDLVRCLDLERKQVDLVLYAIDVHCADTKIEDPYRPLIFIGHSLGGIVLKQVVNEMITRNKQRDPTYTSPIRACLFLAVPHQGTGNADFFGTFLKAISKVLLPGFRPNANFVQDLERKNKKLADITDRFIQILNSNKIDIISCYENRDYALGKGKIVSKTSAILHFAGMTQDPVPIDANHSDVAKFGSASQHQFVQIATELSEISHRALQDLTPQFSALGFEQSPQQRPSNHSMVPPTYVAEPLQPGLEPAFYKLTRYTTVFLVDDSSSMEDIPEYNMFPWRETTNALAACAKLVLGAGGRLEVHFFNSPKVKEDISGVQDLVDFCSGVTPKGDTPTYQKLKYHLEEFMEGFKPLTIQQRENHLGLNLVIFTDGAPEGRFDDIEEVIVDIAQDLDQMRADKYKVGIQWVQIGDDKKVTEFFDKIDDKIKGAHKLKRDIVDTTRYDPQAATEMTYKKIVLGAIDKDWDEEASTAISEGQRSVLSQTPEPRYTPSIPQRRTTHDSMYSQVVRPNQRTELDSYRQYMN